MRSKNWQIDNLVYRTEWNKNNDKKLTSTNWRTLLHRRSVDASFSLTM